MNRKIEATIFATACNKVKVFEVLIQKLKKKLSVLGKSESTYKNYSLHLSQIVGWRPMKVQANSEYVLRKKIYSLF